MIVIYSCGFSFANSIRIRWTLLFGQKFGESGAPWEFMKVFGLTAEHIAQRVRKLYEKVKGKTIKQFLVNFQKYPGSFHLKVLAYFDII